MSTPNMQGKVEGGFLEIMMEDESAITKKSILNILGVSSHHDWTRLSIGNKMKVKAEQKGNFINKDEDMLSLIEGLFHHATRIKLGEGYAKRHPSSNPTPEEGPRWSTQSG